MLLKESEGQREHKTERRENGEVLYRGSQLTMGEGRQSAAIVQPPCNRRGRRCWRAGREHAEASFGVGHARAETPAFLAPPAASSVASPDLSASGTFRCTCARAESARIGRARLRCFEAAAVQPSLCSAWTPQVSAASCGHLPRAVAPVQRGRREKRTLIAI